jgi:hypothetical protein
LRYYLEKVARAPQRESWASVGGSVVHEATELFDRGRFATWHDDIFADLFWKEVLQRRRRTSYPVQDWRAGGRATKANPDKENHLWWLANGPGYVQSWINWRAANPDWHLFDLTGEQDYAIELFLKVCHPKDSTLELLSVADRVFVTPDGELAVLDIKSGTYKPPTPFQLEVNAECFDLTFGIRPTKGAFWDARKGSFSELMDLDTPSAVIWDRAAKARKVRDLELFVPSPSNMCSACGVRDFCPAMKGERAHEYPQHLLPLEIAS